MAIADFSLPPWLAQSNTDLVPNAMAKGAAVGASIAHAMQGAAQIRQAQQRISLMQAEDARQQQEFQQKAQAEAMRYQGFQNFARDREILKAQGANEDFASQQALMKNLHLITAGDPRALATIIDRSGDNAQQAEKLGLQRENLGLQRTRIEEAAFNASERNRLTADKLDITGKALDERIRYHDDSMRFKREKEQADNEAATKLEDQRQKGRIELLNEKSKTTKLVEARLSTNDRLAMQAELKDAETLTEGRAAKIDEINAKYAAIRMGQPLPSDLKFQERQNIIRANLATHEAEVAARKPGGAAPEVREDAAPADGQIYTPQTKAEMDAVPSGKTYINPADGKRYRKK